MNTGISSHVEGYVSTLREQEIATRATMKHRNKDRNNKTKCRLCKSQEETVFHASGSCSSLSSNLTTRHENIARELVYEIANVEKPQDRGDHSQLWWNHPVTTVNKVKHYGSDIIIWDKQDMKCTVIEICAPLDFNVNHRQITKID